MSARVTLLAVIAYTACPAFADQSCVTPPAPDGHEPTCNPFLADSPYPLAHRNNYLQHSTPLRGPEPGQTLIAENLPVPAIPIGAVFSPLYPDGSRAVWMPAISNFQDSLLYKADEASGRVIDVYHRLLDEGAVPAQEPPISRVYGGLDALNRVFRAAGKRIEVLGDANPGQLDSPIALLSTFELPESARCRSGDFVVGLTMLFDGRLAFVTNQGMVGILIGDPGEIADAGLFVTSINGTRCGDPAVPAEDLETITNTLSSDEQGGIYVVTNRAQYRFDAGDVSQSWRAEYQTGTAQGGGVRLDQGSGSSPALMGTAESDDKFVVITDGQQLMHLVLFWRDEIPADWVGLPNRDRRIACEVPVDFGDPARTASQSEQSVSIRGYAAFIPNNELDNAEAIAALPEGGSARMLAAGLAGQSPLNAPHGFERIDWDPALRLCRVVWANQEVSIPNGVPYVSAGSNLVYGIGQRNGIWGLEGMDLDTGESRLFVPSGPLPTANGFFAALNIGADGSAWTGGFFGFTVFRSLEAP